MAASVAPLQVATRAGVAAGASVVVARWLGLPFPIYAMIAAVIVTDLDPAKTRRLSLQRTAGTVLGASLGAVLAPFAPAAWIIGLGVFGAMLACHALRLGDAAKLAGYVCAIVLLEHTGDAWRYGLLRLLETLIGLGLAVAVSVVPKILRTGERPPPDA